LSCHGNLLRCPLTLDRGLRAALAPRNDDGDISYTSFRGAAKAANPGIQLFNRLLHCGVPSFFHATPIAPMIAPITSRTASQ